MSLVDIEQLSLTQKMELLEQIWESMRRESEQIDSPVWHKEILHKRKQEAMTKKVATFTVDEVRQRLG